MDIREYSVTVALINKGFTLEDSRVSSGYRMFESTSIEIPDPAKPKQYFVGKRWQNLDGENTNCTCGYWSKNWREGKQRSLCSHLVAIIYHQMKEEGLTGTTIVEAPKDEFQSIVRTQIGMAIANTSRTVRDIMEAGEIPLLLGTTGCGKTSAVRMIADHMNWKYQEVAGANSFADADLLGLRTGSIEIPGVFARAFALAREGQHVLLMLDELLRFNPRARDILMRPLLKVPASTMTAMGFDLGNVDEEGVVMEAPLWGQDYAPASKVHIVAATNPWGVTLDPALISRFYPVQVNMSESVADMFSPAFSECIKASWAAVANNDIPMGIEYRALERATGPDDVNMFSMFLHRLSIIDRAAATSFSLVLSGAGIQVNR